MSYLLQYQATYNTGKLPPCCFASFSIDLVTHFINKPEALRDLNISMLSSNFLFGITSVAHKQ